MAENNPQFANFKDAFCAYYRVKSEKYAGAVLWRSLPLTRRLLAVPILVFNRTFFATDLDIIRNLAPIQSEEEFSLQLDELYAVNRLERNIRRGFLGIRASGSRLMKLWKTVAPYVTPLPPRPFVTAWNAQSSGLSSVPGKLGEFEGRASATGERARVSPAIVRGVGRTSPAPMRNLDASKADSGVGIGVLNEESALLLRRVKRACDDIVLGVPVADAVVKSGLESVSQWQRLLEANAATNPGFGWMHAQLRQGERLRELEAEMAGLKVVLAEQARELARLREGGQG